ncbi:MAG TPA: Fur family transcriptional regulator [Solirubrobacteraceae bacterium]|nr:Fur family transcriptional regulator [Solirubrobacteraceae bacterium]
MSYALNKMSAITETDERLVSQLRERGMRVTPQRIVIHRELCGHSQHMTAEQVLARVSDVLPGTSLPTVYSTLELLEALGLVRRVGTGNGAVVFDSRVEPHAHTVCRRCGAMADLEGTAAPENALSRASATGFVPDHAQLVVWGLCSACAA